MPGKLDVTVTLKPAIKKVVSGEIKFELSWVMWEDDKVIQWVFLSIISVASSCNDDLAYVWHLKYIIMLYAIF